MNTQALPTAPSLPRSRAARRGLASRLTLAGASVAVAVLLAARPGAAQSAARPSIDRAALEKRASVETRPEEAGRIRERLRDGDFNVGDRIVLDMRRDTSFTHDTLVVRAGRVVSIEGLPDVPLQGILRSELDAVLNDRIGRYIKAPNVRTSTLFRLALLGEVTKPNYYDVRPDMLLSDLVVLAGGPTNSADLDRSIARRGNSELLQPERFRYALRSGQTLDDLGLRAGDQITFGKKKATNWQAIITGVSIGLSLIVATVSLIRR